MPQALIGGALDDAALQTAGEACQAAAQPISDKRGSAAYRKKIVAVLCRRAVQVAGKRALSSSMSKLHITTKINDEAREPVQQTSPC